MEWLFPVRHAWRDRAGRIRGPGPQGPGNSQVVPFACSRARRLGRWLCWPPASGGRLVVACPGCVDPKAALHAFFLPRGGYAPLRRCDLATFWYSRSVKGSFDTWDAKVGKTTKAGAAGENVLLLLFPLAIDPDLKTTCQFRNPIVSTGCCIDWHQSRTC